MIRGTDGLDYETLSDRFLGLPAKTPRNQGVGIVRDSLKDERYVRRWLEIYDLAVERGEPPPNIHAYRGLVTVRDIEGSAADTLAAIRRRYDIATASIRSAGESVIAGRSPHTIIIDEWPAL